MKSIFNFLFRGKQIKRNEEEIKSLKDTIDQQRYFISKIVHETKIHSHYIFLNLSLLIHFHYTPDKEAEYGRLLSSLKESVLKFKTLLGNFSEYVRSQYGKKPILKMETVQVNEYIQSVVKDLRFYWADAEQPLSVRLAHPSFAVVLDLVKFEQVVRTLILNANEHGHGTIDLVITKDSVGGTWNLVITNAYNTVLKEDDTTKDKPGLGLGLGLLISHQLMELMSGELEIHRSEQLFTVALRMPRVMD